MPLGFPADAGVNQGVVIANGSPGGRVPTIGNSGRGIPRTGDIRHIGDIGNLSRVPAVEANGGLLPGAIGQQIPTPPNESYAIGSGANGTGRNNDGPRSTFLFCGKDSGGEGFDGFGSKAGMRTG